jgi:hypothetical protein
VKTNLSLFVVIGIAAASLALGCAQAKVGQTELTGGSQGGGNHGGSGGGGNGIYINTDASFAPPDGRKADLMPDVEPFGYDDSGTPICVSILSLGQPAHYGNQSGGGDSTDAFQAFMNKNTLNANTGTTSKMTMIKKYTPLTADLLKNYNVLILQALEDSEYTGLWTFTQSDIDALKTWVNDKGGAIIAMTGYGGNTTEVNPLNQLLSFSGISYNTDDIFNSCTDNMCYCSYNSIAFNGWQSDYTDNDQLTHNLKKVGVFHGRSINCTGSDCQVFAKDSAGNKVGVAKAFGKGRVLAWADEWVTYTSQWGLVDGQYDNATTYAQCVPYTPKNAYSVPQFWYNAFFWSVPNMQWCFTINVPPEADPGQQIIP